MSTEVADARAEALRNMAAKRNFRRGTLVGGLGGAVVALLAIVALQPSYAKWLAERASLSSDTSSDDDQDQADGRQPERQRDTSAENDSGADYGDSSNDASEVEDAKDSQDGANDGQSVAEETDDANGGDAGSTLADRIEAIRQTFEQRLAALELAPAASSSDLVLDVKQLRTDLMARLDDVDAKIALLEPIAERYRAGYGPGDVEGERSVADFPKSDLRQFQDELDAVQKANSNEQDRAGTLMLNNTTGVAGYVYVNGQTEWLDLGPNEITTQLGEVTIEIPNGGAIYKLSAVLWERDATGRYVMDRPNWPPTR